MPVMSASPAPASSFAIRTSACEFGLSSVERLWALAVEPIRLFTREEPLRGVWRFRAVVDQRTVACMPSTASTEKRARSSCSLQIAARNNTETMVAAVT